MKFGALHIDETFRFITKWANLPRGPWIKVDPVENGGNNAREHGHERTINVGDSTDIQLLISGAGRLDAAARGLVPIVLSDSTKRAIRSVVVARILEGGVTDLYESLWSDVRQFGQTDDDWKRALRDYLKGLARRIEKPRKASSSPTVGR